MAKTDFRQKYLDWLESNIEVVSNTSGMIRLTTPFVDSSNDCIEIYIKIDGNRLLLTDAGETISDLELSGIKISARRKNILQTIAASHGISLCEKELRAVCSLETFAMKANALIQCMIKVSDMLLLADNTVKTIFAEDVKRFFDENKILYVENLSIPGKSTFYASYDFVIPKKGKNPERFITSINSAKENIIKTTIFTWEDVKPVRGDNCALYAIVNDTDKQIPSASITALTNYGINCIPWSEKETHLPELIA